MRSLFLAALLVPCQLIAAELISEPQAMFYYRVALGGSESQQQHSFGFRLDRASFDTGGALDQHNLFRQAAVFDFRMNARGLDGIYFSGNKVLQDYYVNHADETEGESTMTKIRETIDNLPFGVFLGAAIGALLLSGVGG